MLTVGEVGLCRWSVGQGDVSGDVDAFVFHLRSTKPRDGLVLLDIMHDISAPSASDRRRLAEAVRDTFGSNGVAAHAVATNSFIARGVMAAVRWVAPTPFPEGVFRTPVAALAWAVERSPRLDVGAVLADLRSAVPGFDRLF